MIVNVEFPLDPFLDDLHVQETQKPQRNPNPRAVEVSGSYRRDASFNSSFSSASFKSS